MEGHQRRRHGSRRKDPACHTGALDYPAQDGARKESTPSVHVGDRLAGYARRHAGQIPSVGEQQGVVAQDVRAPGNAGGPPDDQA